MTFESILFRPGDPRPDNELATPDFFLDLNLDQIVAAVTTGKGEYRLTPFFHAPLHDVDAVDHAAPHSMILFNEPFAATNEREGSEIARQIISALLDAGGRALCVTHMYELAYGFYQGHRGNALFLRAGRRGDGSRTFKMIEGEPLSTSYGADLYDAIFGAEDMQPETEGQPRAGRRSEHDGSAEGPARTVTDACRVGEGHGPRY